MGVGVAVGVAWCDSCDRDTDNDNRGCLSRTFCAECGTDRAE